MLRQPWPLASNLNFKAGDVVPNMVTSALGEGGAINLMTNAGCPHLIVDIAGWYKSPPAATVTMSTDARAGISTNVAFPTGLANGLLTAVFEGGKFTDYVARAATVNGNALKSEFGFKVGDSVQAAYNGIWDAYIYGVASDHLVLEVLYDINYTPKVHATFTPPWNTATITSIATKDCG